MYVFRALDPILSTTQREEFLLESFGVHGVKFGTICGVKVGSVKNQFSASRTAFTLEVSLLCVLGAIAVYK
jgi:hypothetical protein